MADSSRERFEKAFNAKLQFCEMDRDYVNVMNKMKETLWAGWVMAEGQYSKMGTYGARRLTPEGTKEFYGQIAVPAVEEDEPLYIRKEIK